MSTDVVTPGAFGGAQALRDVLDTPSLAGAQVLAGAAGLDRSVARLNVMEVPDITAWVKADEFLLTTAYPLRGRPDELPALITDLDRAGLAGLGIKLGRYLDEVPGDMLAVADDLGFPIVRLPDGVSFDDILNEVLTGILNRQAQQLARSERIHRAFLQLVLRGQGLPAIARDLAALLDAPAAVVAPDGEVVAGARLEELGLEVPPTHVHLSSDRATAHADAADRDGGDHHLGAPLPCVSVPISAGAREHGFVVGFVDGAPGRSDELIALENAATVAALELTKRREVEAVEDKYRTDLLHDLLRRVEDRDDVLRRAAIFGWDLDRRVICLVVRLDGAATPLAPHAAVDRSPVTTAVRARVLDRDPAAAVVQLSHEVVVLTGAFASADDARRFLGELASAAAVNGPVAIGLSRPALDVGEVAVAYEQASRALSIGRRIHGEGAAVHFDDLGAYRLLSLIEDHRELRTFADEVLGELASDDAGAADLRATLEALLDAGGNLAEAARELHFHYNTLRYRVEKLESIVGPFRTDARIRLNVQLALLVLQMRHLDDR